MTKETDPDDGAIRRELRGLAERMFPDPDPEAELEGEPDPEVLEHATALAIKLARGCSDEEALERARAAIRGDR